MQTEFDLSPPREVYAICDADRRACKIGVSNDARGRIRNLQTGSPVNYKLAHIETVDRHIAAKVERGARKVLTDNGHSKVREWINKCSAEQAREAIITAHACERGRNT